MVHKTLIVDGKRHSRGNENATVLKMRIVIPNNSRPVCLRGSGGSQRTPAVEMVTRLAHLCSTRIKEWPSMVIQESTDTVTLEVR